MADVKNFALSLIASLQHFELPYPTPVPIYTVPPGKKLLVTHGWAHDGSSGVGSMSVSLGTAVGSYMDVLPATSLAGAQTPFVSMNMPFPVAGLFLPAGESLYFQTTTDPGGVITCCFEFFGYLIDA